MLDMVRSMMSHADLPNSFWGHALLTTAYTFNRVPSKKVEKTPYEIWSGISGRKVELEEIQESQSIDAPMEELEQETQVVVEEQPA
ncbi:hypothetical protein KIW84_051602 [Lathyrus oleraceus]|uniref:Uncharacterized protein n=1 Tax=Pisum sativum TaxID=3888 RepID=A0A9D4WLH3_PEA|nr:hypothetical protein KIW84_051602 [Pisum sativum]